jgi:hypothetical protein
MRTGSGVIHHETTRAKTSVVFLFKTGGAPGVQPSCSLAGPCLAGRRLAISRRCAIYSEQKSHVTCIGAQQHKAGISQQDTVPL